MHLQEWKLLFCREKPSRPLSNVVVQQPNVQAKLRRNSANSDETMKGTEQPHHKANYSFLASSYHSLQLFLDFYSVVILHNDVSALKVSSIFISLYINGKQFCSALIMRTASHWNADPCFKFDHHLFTWIQRQREGYAAFQCYDKTSPRVRRNALLTSASSPQQLNKRSWKVQKANK